MNSDQTSPLKFTHWQSRLLGKLLLSLSVGLLLSSGLFYFLSRMALQEQLARQMHQYASLLAETITASYKSSQDFNTIRARLIAFEENLGVRCTLLDSNGVTLADSRTPASQLHRLTFKDIAAQLRAARQRGEFFTSHFSSAEDATIFVTLRAMPGRPGGRWFLRLALPASHLQHPLSTIRGLLVLNGLLALGMSLLLFLFLTNRMEKNLQQLIQDLKETVAGKRQGVTPLPREDKLGEISRLINTLARRLSHSLEELARDREELNAILASISEGILAIDAQKQIVFYNQLAGSFLQIRLQEILHEPYYQIIRHPELLSLIDQFFEKPFRLQEEIVLADERTVEVTLTPLGSDWEQPGCVVVLRDITQYKKLEKIRRDFVANVSHEFKTPLAAIRGYAESLQDWALSNPETSRRYVAKIIAQSRQLENLVSDLLELARIERLHHLELKVFDPLPIVHELVQHFQEVAQQKGVSLEWHPHPPPLPIRGEPEMFRTMLANLIDNAIKYTPKGGRVWISSHLTDSHVRFSVKDTGIGIPEKELERIFERFYRVDKARSRKMGGTGLGLSIVKHLAEIQQARVTVESKESQGSCFSIEFLRG